MRCHICNGFTNNSCIVCGNHTCSLCMDDEGICRRCRTNYSYVGFPRLSNIANPILFIIGISAIFIGFILVALAFMSEDSSIYIFPFIFIESGDPVIFPIIILFIALPIILMLIFMRHIM